MNYPNVVFINKISALYFLYQRFREGIQRFLQYISDLHILSAIHRFYQRIGINSAIYPIYQRFDNFIGDSPGLSANWRSNSAISLIYRRFDNFIGASPLLSAI